MDSRRHRRAFWMVAVAFLAVMAFSAVPSPLYGLYRERDHFSLFMITVVYAVYAVGVLGSLLLAGHLSDWYGRWRLLLPALGLAVVSAIVFLVSAGIAVSAVKLVGRTAIRAGAGPIPAGPGADSLDGKPGHQPIDKPQERRAV